MIFWIKKVPSSQSIRTTKFWYKTWRLTFWTWKWCLKGTCLSFQLCFFCVSILRKFQVGNSHADLEDDFPLPGMYSQVNHVHLPGCRAKVVLDCSCDEISSFACWLSCLCISILYRPVTNRERVGCSGGLKPPLVPKFFVAHPQIILRRFNLIWHWKHLINNSMEDWKKLPKSSMRRKV